MVFILLHVSDIMLPSVSHIRINSEATNPEISGKNNRQKYRAISGILNSVTAEVKSRNWFDFTPRAAFGELSQHKHSAVCRVKCRLRIPNLQFRRMIYVLKHTDAVVLSARRKGIHDGSVWSRPPCSFFFDADSRPLKNWRRPNSSLPLSLGLHVAQRT